MRVLLLYALVLSLASSSTFSSSKDTTLICRQDHLDGSWSRRAPFKTSAHIHYTNEDQKRNSSLAFYIKEKWRTIFVVKILEPKGTMPTVDFEFHDKKGLNSIIRANPLKNQTPQDPKILDIGLVDKEWKVRLATENKDIMTWDSPIIVYTGEGGDLSIQAFAATPYSVTLPCGYSECAEELVGSSRSNKWKLLRTPVALQCTALERNTPAKYNFFVEENRQVVADVEVRITNKVFEISIDSGGEKETCSYDAQEGGSFFKVHEPQLVEVTYAEGQCKIRLHKADSNSWIKCSSGHAPTNGTGSLTLQVASETDVAVKHPCRYEDVTYSRPARTYYILAIICLTLVALIVLACCVCWFLSWRRRRCFKPSTRKSSISKT